MAETLGRSIEMRSITILMGSTEAEKAADYTFEVQRLRGDTWVTDSSVAITSGTADAEKKVLLDDNTRVVIMARGADTEVVFDREQNAAMPRHALESQTTLADRAIQEEERQTELRHTDRNVAKIQEVGNRAAEVARDKAIEEEKARVAARAKQAAPLPNSTPNLKPPSGAATPNAGSSGMTAPGPSTGGQSSKDVK